MKESQDFHQVQKLATSMSQLGSNSPKDYNPGNRTAMVLLVSIFVSELLIMLIGEGLKVHITWIEALLDSILLAILIFPAIYFLVVRPMAIQNKARKRAEVQIKTILNTTIDGFYLVDTEGRILETNDSYCSMIGYSREELLKMSVKDIEAVDSEEVIKKRIQRILVTGYDNFETKHFRKDGRVIDLEASVSFLIEEQPKLFCFMRNITERKQAEKMLKESEKDLNRAQKVANYGNWKFDVQTQMPSWSLNMYRIFGLDQKNGPLDYSEHKKIIFPDDWEEFDAAVQLTSKTGKGYKITIRINRPDGELRWITTECETRKDDEDRVIELFGITQDITERKQMEEALLNSEQDFRSLAESMPQIVWATRADGWNIYFNQQWVDYTGMTLEASCGHGWNKPFHPDDQQRAWDAWQNAVNNNGIYSIEVRLRRYDGDYRWWLVRGIPLIDVNGKILKWFGTCTDIEDIKQVEYELKKAKEKAEESDHLKTSFLHNISHEIRTPLNGLLGFLSILQDNDIEPVQRGEYVELINQSAYRFMNTVDDIVEVSQIQSGLLEINASEINVHRIIKDLCNRYQSEAEFKRLKFYLRDELPISFGSINTDENKLNAIISILLNNAIKFTKEGSIEFAVKVNSTIEPFELGFSVKDTGVGIPEDKRQTIFEPFMQVDSSDTRPFEGSGLGLSIAKSYVEMLGGKIWLESDPDGQSGKSGSTFYFTIPYKTISTEKLSIENFVPSENKVIPINPIVPLLKILIVEDDEVSELFLRKAIKLFSKEILHAKTGAEAVDASQKDSDIDLILMDIKMTGMSGYEATRQIRQFNKEVIIIAQTAFGLIDDRQKAIESGCNDYISKPIQKDKLINIVEKYFGRQEKS